MRRYVHEVVVNTPPETLWRAIVDIRRWPARGGPAVAMSVEAIEPPNRFVDLAHLPLAKMRGSHEFLPERGGTRIRVTIAGRPS